MLKLKHMKRYLQTLATAEAHQGKYKAQTDAQTEEQRKPTDNQIYVNLKLTVTHKRSTARKLHILGQTHR